MAERDYAVDKAIAAYNARVAGEGPPVPSRAHMRIPFQDWLAEKSWKPGDPPIYDSRAAEYQAYLDEKYPKPQLPPEGQLGLPFGD